MKITVAIPTIAGRSKYLQACLATCVAQAFADVEFLVSDNSEGEARAVVNACNDPRVRYIRPAQYLPMSAHWDYVLSNVDGDVICFIGDDDALMPDCLDTLATVYQEFGNVPVHHSLCNYYWNDSPVPAERNKVLFLHGTEEVTRSVSSTEYLAQVCRGEARYLDGPMIYHNFIPLQIVRNLTRDGVFFLRSSPDVYSAIAIAAHTDAFVSVGRFLTVAGQGARSNGAAVRHGAADGLKFLAESTGSRYASRFGSRTVQLQLVDAVLEVAREFGHVRLSPDFTPNLRIAVAECLAMPGLLTKASELAEVFAVARAQRVVGALLADVARRAVRMALANAVRPSSSERNASSAHMRRGQTIQLGADVADIRDASLALQRFLAGCGSPAQ